MRLLLIVSSLMFTSILAFAAALTQTFSTSAGPVKITPLYHASTLIEASDTG